MALIICPECGRSVSDKAEICPNCGYPVSKEIKSTEQGMQEPYNEQLKTEEHEPKDLFAPTAKIIPIIRWVLAIFILIFALAVLTESILGGLLMIASAVMICPLSARFVGNLRMVWRCLLPIFFLFFGFAFFVVSIDESDAETAYGSIEEAVAETPEILSEAADAATRYEEVTAVEAIEVEETVESETEVTVTGYDEYTSLFYYDLLLEFGNLEGEKVNVIVPYASTDGNGGIRSESPHYSEIGISSYVEFTPDITIELSEGDYINVCGTVGDGYHELNEAHIISYGSDELKVEYAAEYAEWQERQAVAAMETEEAFRQEAVECTYDDLYRYPDTYKNIKIKVTVKITRVEPDGFIFDGDVWAELEGNEVAIYDEREPKEPTLKEGDKITIYGYGNGLTTIKVQDQSGIIPKTVDKYSIPGIKIVYMDLN